VELNTISLSDFVALAKTVWIKEKKSLVQSARKSGMFVEDPIPQNSGNSRQYSEIDLEEYAKVKGQGDQAQRARVQQGYNKTLTLYRVAVDIGITYEMRSQNKYPEVVRRLTNLASLGENRMDLDLTHRFTFGTATSYTDMDGRTVDTTVGDETLALFGTAHTLRGSSTTFRNRLANNPQLSKGALEGMEQLVVEQTYNQHGEKVSVPFDIIWTSDDPNTINVAREYLQSTAAVEATNNGVVNVYKGKYRHVILPRLATSAVGAVDSTKRRYWGLASSMMSSAYLAVHESPRLKTPSNLNAGEEFSTDDWNFGVRAGYGIAVVSGAWVKFSSGDGVA
jgi:hypothetical protein